MSPLLIAAAESSKVPFFICGGLLAVWAVILAALGLSRPTFPGNSTGQRGIVAISFVLMLIAIAAAVLTD
jgi:hypothetical protein